MVAIVGHEYQKQLLLYQIYERELEYSRTILTGSAHSIHTCAIVGVLPYQSLATPLPSQGVRRCRAYQTASVPVLFGIPFFLCHCWSFFHYQP